MADPAPRTTNLLLSLSGLLLLGAGAAAGWAYERASGGGQEAFEQRVRSYLVAHPEVLAEAADAYRKQNEGKQVADVADRLEQPFPGAVLGNPGGKQVLVEFTDFACTYCRTSVPVIEALIAANPDLKIVIRELPIIAPTSPDAARWGLAAAQQGKYPAFHNAMFAAGRTDMASIEGAARAAGLDLESARTFAASPTATAELAANLDMARKLGIDGTPSWIAGEQLVTGALGQAELAKLIAGAKAE
ncbi:MAG: DsbA family protein [Novosphingobium sp.]|uniref:DsbA family protein n=1 Tax=Novosphingobium sp. TaxID=1874826 RepID=UPI0032BC81ED